MPAGITPGGENVGRAYISVHANASSIPGDIEDGLNDADRIVKKKGEDHSDSYFDRWDERMKRVSSNIDRIATRSGRLFGKGSRNNFLNFLGSAAEKGVRLSEVFPIVGRAISAIGRAFSGSETQGGGFRNLISSLPGLLGTAAAGLLTLTAGFTGLAAILGIISTVLSAIVAVLISLASTITFAVLGGVGALVGVLGVLGFAVAGIGLGIAGLSKKQKKLLTEAVKPLVAGFKELARETARSLFADAERQARDLVPVVHGLIPLFKNVGSAISDVASGWIDSLDSPGFRLFSNRMTRFIPDAIRSLGRIIDNTFGGLGGIFIGLIPITERFLRWLEKITGEFNHWANTRQGRSEIRQFFRDAADSAKRLGGFLLSVVDLVAQLFDDSRTTGDDLFLSMTNNIKDLVDFIERNPDAVSKFFRDGQAIAEDVGKIAVEIGKLIGKMDAFMGNPLVRFGLTFVRLQLLLIEGLLWLLEKAISGVSMAAQDLWGQIEKVGHFLHGLGEDIARFFSRFGGGGGGRLQFINLAFVREQTQKVVKFFRDLPGQIRAAISNIPNVVRAIFHLLPPKAQETIISIANWFAKLPGRIRSEINDIPGNFRDLWHNVVDFVQGIPGRIAGIFVGLAGKILHAIGPIDIGSLIKLPNLASGKIWDTPGSGPPTTAWGGLFGKITHGPQLRWVGEDGPEAIVPLARDLARVDPSVRWLSAIAQGKGMASGGVSSGKTIDASGWIIQSNSDDPETVAQEALNRLFAQNF